MNWITAKEAIDFLKAHSNEKKKVYIAFYGGEPLLEFELIRKCVHYAQSIMPGKEIEYSMTTNGTLLNKEVIEYLVERKFEKKNLESQAKNSKNNINESNDNKSENIDSQNIETQDNN